MKKPNLQRLVQRSKIYLRKASPTILSGLGAAGVIVTSVLAVRATPKALRKIRADSKANHTGIYWIDFNHSKVTLDDGLEVLVIDMDWVPDAGWDSE